MSWGFCEHLKALWALAQLSPATMWLYMGETKFGSAVPWALDDAIDNADIAAALKLLPRLIPYEGTPSERNVRHFA